MTTNNAISAKFASRLLDRAQKYGYEARNTHNHGAAEVARRLNTLANQVSTMNFNQLASAMADEGEIELLQEMGFGAAIEQAVLICAKRGYTLNASAALAQCAHWARSWDPHTLAKFNPDAE